MKIRFKRFLFSVLSSLMTVSTVPIVSVHAEESTEPYPYTLFAASSDEGSITINTEKFCVNGNVTTNDINAGYLVINCKKDVISNG